eukprot:969699-Pyramimonas_sp.AAC.1
MLNPSSRSNLLSRAALHVKTLHIVPFHVVTDKCVSWVVKPAALLPSVKRPTTSGTPQTLGARTKDLLPGILTDLPTSPPRHVFLETRVRKEYLPTITLRPARFIHYPRNTLYSLARQSLKKRGVKREERRVL